MFDLRSSELHGEWLAVSGEAIDHRTAGVAQAEQLGDFIEGFAGGVVASVADVFITPCFAALLSKIEVSVSARNDKSEYRESQFMIALLPLLQQYGVNVPFKMIHGNQGLLEREGQSLGEADAHQK